MSDEFGQLLSEQKEVAISQGAVVSGQVIAVKEDEIVLNIGYKADAVISRNEFTNIPNAIGTSSNGSYPFLIARYKNTSATRIINRLPHDRLKNAVWWIRLPNVSVT